MNNGSAFDNRTCFKGVYKLTIAHYLFATSPGSIEVRPYWDSEYPDKNIKESRSVNQMIEGVRSRLIESIKQRLVANVPVGFYLSGGVDSSSIAGIATNLLREKSSNAKIAAFSISFLDDSKFDEVNIAERTAKFCDIEFNRFPLTEDILVKIFEEFLWHVEQPSGNLNGVAKFPLSKFVRNLGYKVVLTGEGTDEHFAGYSFFHGDYLRELDNPSPDGFGVLSDIDRRGLYKDWETKNFRKYSKIVNFGDKVIEGENSVSRKMVNNINAHLCMSDIFSLGPTYYNNIALDYCGKPSLSLALAEAIGGVARRKANSIWHPFHSALYIESHTLLANYHCNILSDCSEMAHSIEARTTFLDHHLCEYVNSLPPSLNTKPEENGILNKIWILKEAAKPFITEELYHRTKHVFEAPPSKGRSSAIIGLIEKLITKEKIDKLGWLEYKNIAKAKKVFFDIGGPSIFKDLLIMMSYVIISERFNVATFDTCI